MSGGITRWTNWPVQSPARAYIPHQEPCSSTSRVSVELVQKTARMGVPLLVAVSAPTSLAIETAEQAGITLVAVARDDGYEIFSHADRLIFGGELHSATPRQHGPAVLPR